MELWQEYEDELLDKMSQRDAAEVHKQHLEVEKEFLEKAMAAAPNESVRLQLMGRYSGIDHQIITAENDRMNLEEEITGLEFVLDQIENAVESPVYRKYGKREIGVHIHRDCEEWLKKRKRKGGAFLIGGNHAPNSRQGLQKTVQEQNDIPPIGANVRDRRLG